MTAALVHIVTWKRDGLTHLLDFNREIDAQSVAIALAETGRYEVKVTAVEQEIDPEIKERIKRRVFETIKELEWTA